jgi:hypothetical protein
MDYKHSANQHSMLILVPALRGLRPACVRSVMSERTGGSLRRQPKSLPASAGGRQRARHAWPERAVCGTAGVRDWSPLGGLTRPGVLRLVNRGVGCRAVFEDRALRISAGRIATQLNVTFCDRYRSWLTREEPLGAGFDSAPIRMPGIPNWTSRAVLSARLAAIAVFAVLRWPVSRSGARWRWCPWWPWPAR